MKYLLLFILLFSYGFPALASLTDPKLKWKTVDTEHFSINYYEGEEEIANRLVTVSEETYDILSKKFDARPWGKTEVVIVDNDVNAGGFTLAIPYNIVILRVVTPLPDSARGDYDDWLRQLFLHEYTHVLHITDTRYPAKALKFVFGKMIAPNGLSPGWVTDGLATYMETAETERGPGQASFTDMLLRTDILEGKFLHLDQMAGNQFDWPGRMAPSLYGVAFWQYLAEKYGEETLIDFSHKYGASLRFFMLNSQAKRVFRREGASKGVTFYKLWEEWKGELEGRYAGVKEKLKAEGLKEGEPLLTPEKGESFSVPTFSPDGKSLVYLATSVHHNQELRLRDLGTGKERVLMRDKDIAQISFSPNSEKIVVAYSGHVHLYWKYSDLYEVDLKTGESKSLTHGMRARDPDYSPDGKRIVAVVRETGYCNMWVYEVDTEKWASVFSADQFDHPRWLPDGRSIIVSVHKKGQRDLWVIDTSNGHGKRITSDTAVDDNPSVDSKNRIVYYSSDKSGIPNLYRYDLKNGHVSPITNVLTGAFAPSVSPEGTVIFQYYNGRGFEIRKMGGEMVRAKGEGRGLTGERSQRLELTSSEESFSRGGEVIEGPGANTTSPQAAPPGSKTYNPFRHLFIPRTLLPRVGFIDGALFASATVFNFDPLYWHSWYGDVTYRNDNNFVGFDVGYNYMRYAPNISVGFNDFTVNYGDVFGLGTDFSEEHRRGYVGVVLPPSPHKITLQYFFENWSRQSGIPSGSTLAALGNRAGFYLQYAYSDTPGTAAKISPEGGQKATVNLEITDSVLGSSEQLEQQVVWVDYRKYFLMPYGNHHVIALRATGGMAFGDHLPQGNFGLGGSMGENFITSTSRRAFALRGIPGGTFSRDNAWVASAEYRLPIVSPQRGLGTMPFFVKNIHFALFADIGDAFNWSNRSFQPLLAVGGEFRGDFVIAYHIPITGRLGYGVVLTSRSRINGMTDSLTGADARNGVILLQIGTSY